MNGVATSETNLGVDGKDNVWITTADGRRENNTHVFVAVKTADGELFKNGQFGIGDKYYISLGQKITGIT